MPRSFICTSNIAALPAERTNCCTLDPSDATKASGNNRTIHSTYLLETTTQRVCIRYQIQQSSLNTNANALSCLRSLSHMMVPLFDYILLYPDDAAVAQTQTSLASDSAVSNYSLLTHHNSQSSLSVSITTGEMCQE